MDRQAATAVDRQVAAATAAAVKCGRIWSPCLTKTMRLFYGTSSSTMCGTAPDAPIHNVKLISTSKDGYPMASSAEHLILRGLSIVMRASFSPNEPTASAKHFQSLQNDIGPWFTDCAAELEKPVIDFLPTLEVSGGGERGGPVKQ